LSKYDPQPPTAEVRTGGALDAETIDNQIQVKHNVVFNKN